MKNILIITFAAVAQQKVLNKAPFVYIFKDIFKA